jgi:hypothetical protein
MKPTTISALSFLCLCLIVFCTGMATAQGYDDPLTIQGIDHTTNPSAMSRSLGGITVGLKNDAGLMFLNPATLGSITGPQVVVGGSNFTVNSGQVQQYAPLKYYSNFSLLMEGLTGYIPNPTYDTSVHSNNAGDSVQRPFDSIGPDWTHFRNKNVPLQAMVAVPFFIGSQRFVVGGGMTEYANLNHYYQNNNILSPAIGSERPIPTPLPGSQDSVQVQWYQYLRSRDGSIRGFGGALSTSLSNALSVGFSTLVLSGSTDDYELHTGRGRLKFFGGSIGYFFRNDSVYNHTQWKGTSDYSGTELTFSGQYRGKNVTIGASVKPAMTITRKYSTVLSVDTTGTAQTTSISGEDKIKLPWRGSIGLSLAVRPEVTIGFEYEIRSYESAVYTSTDSVTANPWLSASIYHAGIEYVPVEWLALRAGVRGQTELFTPAGAPIGNDPAGYAVYSGGLGLSYSGVRLDLVYEYGRFNYDETWQTNVNLNSETHRSVAMSVSYTLPVWEP